MISAAQGDKHHIIQGEFLVLDRPESVISTILGSCVAACMRDPVAGVGGMNHFLLPGEGGGREGVQYGAYAMELLINGLLSRGASRERLEAKLFGGGRLLRGMTDIGRQNGEFAKRFLRDEGLAFVGGSLGGDHARRILYWPVSGRVQQQRLMAEKAVFSAERTPPPPERVDGDLELFGD